MSDDELRFQQRLALHLGLLDAAEMDSLPAESLDRWRAFDVIEPIGLDAGFIVQAIAATKGIKVKPEDVLRGKRRPDDSPWGSQQFKIFFGIA